LIYFLHAIEKCKVYFGSPPRTPDTPKEKHVQPWTPTKEEDVQQRLSRMEQDAQDMDDQDEQESEPAPAPAAAGLEGPTADGEAVDLCEDSDEELADTLFEDDVEPDVLHGAPMDMDSESAASQDALLDDQQDEPEETYVEPDVLPAAYSSSSSSSVAYVWQPSCYSVGKAHYRALTKLAEQKKLAKVAEQAKQHALFKLAQQKKLDMMFHM
jgi:hypothetical protein